jgi:acyl dehydratase
MPRVVAIDELPALVGRRLEPSDWFTVDQDRIDRFADVTEDRQWIHVDVERATREIGSPIAHGFLTLSLLSAMTYQVLRIEGASRGVNYGFDKIRFLKPVAAGARVRLHETVTSVESKAGGVAVTRDCTVEIEGEDKPALVATWVGVVYA